MGHIYYIKAAKELGDHLVVIINNDIQQRLKKGKIIMYEEERSYVVEAVGYVDEVIVAVDEDSSVTETIKLIAEKYKDYKIIFANGGDRRSEEDIPEARVCKEYNIEMKFAVGGEEKVNSSSDINKRLGLE